MLRAARKSGIRKSGGRFVIVASRYNARYVDAMLRAAKGELTRAGVDTIKVIRVPGAFEIPGVASRLAADSSMPWSAILCLGVILRGATVHAEHIAMAITNALMQVQLMHRTPVVHEVLLLESEQQARERCLAGRRNRGLEAAQTALEMAKVMREW